MSTELVHYDAARRELAQARRVDEVKNIHDKAKALEAYAKMAKDTEGLCWWIEIRMRAAIRAGEMLIELPKNKGARAQGRPKIGDDSKRVPKNRDSTPTLTDLGVTSQQSSRWQKLARLPKPDQERRVKAAQEAAGSALAKAAKPPRKPSEPKKSKSKKTEDELQRALQIAKKLAKSRIRKERAAMAFEFVAAILGNQVGDIIMLHDIAIEVAKKAGKVTELKL